MNRRKGALFLLLVVGFMLMLPIPRQGKLLLRKGTAEETMLYVLDSGKKGPVVFVIAGIHGNEQAGIEAAIDYTNKIPTRGKLLILPKANNAAAKEGQRTLYDMQDLNRTFPGRKQGTSTQQLAWEITETIKKNKPNILLDLHESSDFYEEGKETLGSTLIISTAGNAAAVALEILDPINLEEKVKFTLLTGAPSASINKVLSEQLGIPVITVETSMKLPLDIRIKQHTKVIEAILSTYGMDE